MKTSDIIHGLELSLLTPEVRTSREKLNQLLADDFVEYGSAGLIYDKNITLEKLPSGKSPTYHLYDFEVVDISDTVVQARYKTERINLDGSKLISLRNSLWRNTNENWQMFFHQGTPVN